MRNETFDRAVIGGGLFGMYAASILVTRGYRVAVIEAERTPLMRASLVNQARLHMGYHYPRSAFTAIQAAGYFERFVHAFPEAVRSDFSSIYAVAAEGSQTNAQSFERFCEVIGIPLAPIDKRRYFMPGTVEAAYLTREYAFDAAALRDTLAKKVVASDEATLLLGRRVVGGDAKGAHWQIRLADGSTIGAGGIVNATYASSNQILSAFGFGGIDLKYEICEVVLVRPNPVLADLAITVMDGPFFSVMPFGHQELHTLTGVALTPRVSSHDRHPSFPCQQRPVRCRPNQLASCAPCRERPASAFTVFERLVRRYLEPSIGYEYAESLFAMKAVLRASEVDDARPTLTLRNSVDPPFTTVFSGKVSTVFDLDEVEL